MIGRFIGEIILFVAVALLISRGRGGWKGSRDFLLTTVLVFVVFFALVAGIAALVFFV